MFFKHPCQYKFPYFLEDAFNSKAYQQEEVAESVRNSLNGIFDPEDVEVRVDRDDYSLKIIVYDNPPSNFDHKAFLEAYTENTAFRAAEIIIDKTAKKLSSTTPCLNKRPI